MHQDDLAGMLLAQQAAGGDQWTVVELKAVAPDGSALWPEKFDSDALARIKANISAKDWISLYQQEPTAETGSYFKEEWIKPIVWPHNRPPPFIRCYGASDYAVTSGGGDWTVHVVIGIDPANRMHLLDVWRKQTGPKEWVESLCDLILKWKPSWWGEERIQITAGVGPYLATRMQSRRAFVAREQFTVRYDKSVRSQSIRGRMELGGLYCPADAPWLSELKAELLAFPDGKHDDQVDALGLVGQLMDRYAPGVKPPKQQKDIDCGYKPAELLKDAIPSFMTL
jgi:predicted phage terminase large subunit-like protein